MPKLRTLGSDDVLKILFSFGFELGGQKGSHMKLIRQSVLGRQVLTIPRNDTLPKGTLKAIYNQASRFVSQEELQKYFYTE